MVINSNLKEKADKLFWIFEEKFFTNQGNYPRKTNLVLEFSEFIENSSQQDLSPYLSFKSEAEFYDFKKMISEGIDHWLDAGDIKTLFL